MDVELTFTALSRVPTVVRASAVHASSPFTSRSNPGANKRVGARPDSSVVQRALVPTSRFLQELRDHVDTLSGTKLPLRLELAGQSTAFNLRITEFPPLGLRATVLLGGLSIDGSRPAEALITLQAAREQEPLSTILRRTFGMMRALDHRSYEPAEQPAVLCGIHIVVPGGTSVHEWVGEHEPELVGALLRVPPADLTEAIVKKIIAESATLNEKTTATYALLTRTSVIHVSARDRDPQPNFRALVELQAMAAATRDFLRAYPTRRTDAPAVFDFFLHIVRGWIERPGVAMPYSYGGAEVWKRLCDVMALSECLKEILTPEVEARLARCEPTFAAFRVAYWEDENFESRLADDVAEREHSGFTFVQDPELRRIIRRDLDQARTCLEVRAHKAALVLAGSVAEALLLAAVLSSRATKSESELQKLGLHALAAEAQRSGVMVDDKTLKLVDDWLRHYRNLIHPGNERLGKNQPDEDKAELAVQAVELLARELDTAASAAGKRTADASTGATARPASSDLSTYGKLP